MGFLKQSLHQNLMLINIESIKEEEEVVEIRVAGD